MENRPSDRQPVYKLSVAFFIRDILKELKRGNGLDEEKRS